MTEAMLFDGLIQFDTAGLIPVIAQDDESGEVLLLAYMNKKALRLTLSERILVLWSRSRDRLWRKGEESGNTLRLVELRLNCEGNSLLARVRLEGSGACHEGYRSCYFRRVEEHAGKLKAIVDHERVFDPAIVYGRALAFEQSIRDLYRAYERLRDAGLDPSSATSRLLHQADRAAASQQALKRARQELAELRGVIAGTHRHQGDRQDVILEASQVGYWTIVVAVARRVGFDEWRPDLAWFGDERGKAARAATAKMLRSEDCEAVASMMAECWSLLEETGDLCRQTGVEPAQVVAHDLEMMRARRRLV